MKVLALPRIESGCLSYVVADETVGDSLLIDPPEDSDGLLRMARSVSERITSIVETHTHADHLSGAHRLGRILGVPVLLPERSRAIYPHTPYPDGGTVRVGDVELRALSTPGHTADSMSLVGGGHALVGDALLVGTVGRADFYPDGIEELYHTIFDRLLRLDDGLLVHPAHFGPLQGLPDRIATTIGEERTSNGALTQRSKADFVRYMTEDWPPKPRDWERIVAQNLTG